MGHDWGSALAWHMAMTAPNRVPKLVVMSVGCLGEAPAVPLGTTPRTTFLPSHLCACRPWPGPTASVPYAAVPAGTRRFLPRATSASRLGMRFYFSTVGRLLLLHALAGTYFASGDIMESMRQRGMSW